MADCKLKFVQLKRMYVRQINKNVSEDNIYVFLEKFLKEWARGKFLMSRLRSASSLRFYETFS